MGLGGLRHVPTEVRRPGDNDYRHAEKAYESDKVRHFNLHGWSSCEAITLHERVAGDLRPSDDRKLIHGLGGASFSGRR